MNRFALAALLAVATPACGDSDDTDVPPPVEDVPEIDVVPDVGPPDVADDAEVLIGPGPCAGLNDGDPCDDGSVCSLDDYCDGGFCVHDSTMVCDPPAGADCVTTSCDAAEGCIEVPAPEDSECDVVCYTSGRCLGGQCVPEAGKEVVCPTSENPCVDKVVCDPETGGCTRDLYKLACPSGSLCHAEPGEDGGAKLECLPTFTTQCMPCKADAACAEAEFADNENLCVSSGPGGSFCAGDCSSIDCPAGFECKVKPGADGSEAKVCVPEPGAQCECNPAWAAMGLITDCVAINEFGTCKGKRGCAVGGLTDCDAPSAAEEICDGVDNDCNDEVDELECGTLGACCVGGACKELYDTSCLAANGKFQGAGVECAQAACDAAAVGACCQSDATCKSLPIGQCLALGGKYQGDGAECDATDCEEPIQTGACCYLNSTCTHLEQITCNLNGGFFQGVTASCQTTDCPTLGACCQADSSCSVLPADACAAQSGDWSAAAACEVTECVLAPGQGACCGDGGSCVVLGKSDCSGDSLFLEGEKCTGQCPAAETGACCALGGNCTLGPQGECAEGSDFKGVGSTCPDACVEAKGACCKGTNCSEVTQKLCDTLGWKYKGDGITCPVECDG